MNKFRVWLESFWKWVVSTATRYYRGIVYGDDKAIRDVVSINESKYIPECDQLARQLADNQITIGQWQSEMKSLIKKQYIQSGIAGKGGRDAMTQADWGRMGGRLNFQYRKLDGFAREIVDMSNNGTPYSFRYIRQRSRLYAKTFRTAYYDAKTAAMKVAGRDQERRFLGVSEHCPDCIYWAEQGWQPIGSLPEPGQASVCLSNCQCVKRYRRNPDQ